MGILKPEAYVNNTACFLEKNFAKLREKMFEHRIPAGSFLFQEGDPANKLFFIKEGCVKISKSTKDGKEFILYLLHEGDLLGQLDSYKDSTQNFHAKALENCVFGTLQIKDLEVLIMQHGDLAIEFIKWIGLTHQMTQMKFRDLMLYGKEGALSSTLIRLSKTYGKQVEKGCLISKKLTHTELANYIGATRESVNRMLSHFKKENVICFDDGYITIINTDSLKKICNCEDCPKEICSV